MFIPISIIAYFVLKINCLDDYDIVPLHFNMKLAQLYDDNTGDFLNETLFADDIDEGFVQRKDVNESSIRGPLENSYENLFQITGLERCQQLSLLTGLVESVFSWFMSGYIRYQITDNVYRPKASTFYYYPAFSKKTFNLTGIFAGNNTLNRNYLAKSNATHYISEITYGTRFWIAVQPTKLELNDGLNELFEVAKNIKLYSDGNNSEKLVEFLENSSENFIVSLYSDKHSHRDNLPPISAAKLARNMSTLGYRLFERNMDAVKYQLLPLDATLIKNKFKYQMGNDLFLMTLRLIDKLNVMRQYANGLAEYYLTYDDYMHWDSRSLIYRVQDRIEKHFLNVKNELGKVLLKLRLGLINETSYKEFLKNVENNDELPAKSSEQEKYFKEGVFKKIDQEVNLYKEILKNKQIIFSQSESRFEDYMRWIRSQTGRWTTLNMDIVLFVVKYDIKPCDDVYQAFEHLSRGQNNYTIWAINIEIFDKDFNQTESKARLIYYRNGFVEFDNYEEIVKLHLNGQLGKLTMPPGFIYAQINENDHPNKFWPDNNWQDVSEQYAGLFFRVEGGKSRAFGRTQEQSYSDVVEIENSVNTKIQSKVNITLIPGQWSEYLRTGGTEANKKRIGISFHVTKDEVRPKNSAFRLWKCLGDITDRHEKLWTRESIEKLLLTVSPCYIQLHKQLDPNTLWNSKEWSDVTQQYSGLFFRVVDNNNNKVQSVQNQSGPVIDRIRSKVMDINSDEDISKINWVTIKAEKWSEYIKVGKSGNDCQGLRFRIKDQEIRPMNQAIRIWKREEVKVNVTNSSIDNMKKLLNNTINNLVPPGFIYFQLGEQLKPNELWPSYQWQDISTQNSGLFFRAMANQSEEFGSIQSQSYPHLSEVSFGEHFDCDSRAVKEISLEANHWSPYLKSGSDGDVWNAIRFRLYHEVRPTNQAIRIWRRI